MRRKHLPFAGFAFLALGVVWQCAIAALPIHKTAEVDKAKDGAGREGKEPIMMWRATYADENNASLAARTQCAFEDKFDDAIRKEAKERDINIEFVHIEQEFEKATRQLLVTIEDADANAWHGGAYRPSSLVTFTARIVVGGDAVRHVTKRIGSGMSFTACQRLERIATVGGTIVADWVARSAL